MTNASYAPLNSYNTLLTMRYTPGKLPNRRGSCPSRRRRHCGRQTKPWAPGAITQRARLMLRAPRTELTVSELLISDHAASDEDGLVLLELQSTAPIIHNCDLGFHTGM